MYLLASFILQNFKKIIRADPGFWAQNNPFVLNKIFLVQTIIITFIHLFKKILTTDPELWGCKIDGPKMTHFPKWEFFRKTC